MANLRTWRGTAAGSTNLPQLQFKALLGQHIVVPIGGTPDYGVVLAEGTQLVFDFAAFWEGEVCYQPKFDDTRMRLRGTELPDFSNEDGYTGGIKINVMVQRHGLCSMLSTSEAVSRMVDMLYDAFVFAVQAEAGQLPVYRLAEARGYHTRYRPETLYAPVYIFTGWVARDPNAFGPRLIAPPKPPLVSTEVITAPAAETDKVFADIARLGEVLPAPASDAGKARGKVRGKPAAKSGNPQPISDDLDDELPF
jgi:hypothetical protein